MTYILMAIYFLLTSGGLILMKLGASKVKLNVTSSVFGIVLSWQYLLGILCYLGSFLLFSYLLTKTKLTYIYPLSASICYILVIILSCVFLKEQLTLIKIIGIIITLVGVIIMNLAK